MKYAAALLAGLALAGCDGGQSNTLPDGVSAQDVALYKMAVADAGCTISTRTQGDAIAAQTGFARDKLALIAQYLVLAGESERLEDTGFRLTSGPCANA